MSKFTGELEYGILWGKRINVTSHQSILCPPERSGIVRKNTRPRKLAVPGDARFPEVRQTPRFHYVDYRSPLPWSAAVDRNS